MGHQGEKGKAGGEDKSFPFRSSERPLPLAWIARHRTVGVYRAEFQPRRLRRLDGEELLLRESRVRSARDLVQIFEEMAERWAALYGPHSYHVRLARTAAQIAAMTAEYRARELLEMVEEEE